MSHQHRSTVVVGLAAVLLVALAGVGSACVGARALAMGGAFVGLADDVSATYWNPAALVYLDGKYVTWMHTANNRESINYQDYFAYAAPLDEKSAIGLSYIGYQLVPSLEMYGDSISWDESWLWVSYGAKVSEKTSVGANVRFISDDLQVVEDGVPLDISAKTDMGFDLALYHHASETVTLGLLVQDVNEPEVSLSGGGETVPVGKHVRNYRPGAAVRVPDQNIIVSAEVYDALDDGDARALRVGLEKKFPENRFALRAGRYAGGDISGLTLGAGVWNEQGSLDIAYMGGDLDGTWLVSATGKF